MLEMGTNLEKIYVQKNNKMLAYGYTTGSCAAAAAQGAARLLLTGIRPAEVVLMTPKGIRLRLVPEECYMEGEEAVCVIRKDSGDDPDMTDGILVYAHVKKIPDDEILLEGGVGVGRVTRPGLEQPVGEAAINRVPRQMIRQNLEEVREDTEYRGGLSVIISIPQGVEIGKRTFNPRLGIVGGISVLGTSGIVEPMSEDALIRSIQIEMKQLASTGRKYLVITPGNYGADYVRENLDLDLDKAVKCSNYVGEMIDYAVELGLTGILFISHIGKVVKVAGGIMNTHSRNADCRAEILAAHSLRAGIGKEAALEILDSLTTDAALDIMDREGVTEAAMKTVMAKIADALDRRCYGKLQIGVLAFSKDRGELGRTSNFDEILQICREQDGRSDDI